jgi:polyketide biosynthesis acyl carrier protein
MTKENVFEVVKESIIEILPDISDGDILIEKSLKDLGANSIDRMDVVVQSMETLGIKIPMLEFGNIKNIQGLVDLLYEKKVELG